MKIRTIVKLMDEYGRLHMIEGILQGVDPCKVAEYDGEYDEYATRIMERLKEGHIRGYEDFLDWMVAEYKDNFGYGTIKMKLVPMIWNIIRHHKEEG